MISSDQAWFISVFVQAILYGFYLTTLVYCLRWLLYEDKGWKLRSREKVNSLMVAFTIIIFILSTADLAMSLQATIFPVSKENLEYNRLEIVNNAIENATILITDAVLILRCWVVYDKLWRVIVLPALLWLSSVTCTALLIYWFAMWIADSRAQTGFYSMSHHALVGFLACNFANNVYVACAIVYRIWPMTKDNGDRAGFLYSTCCIFAESGILYASTSLLLLVTRVINPESPGLPGWLSDSLNFSMAGIAFNLILIRTGQYRANQAANFASTPLAPTTGHQLPSTSTFNFPRDTSDWPPECSMAERGEVKDYNRC